MRSCHTACCKLCASYHSFCHCAGCKYRFDLILAAVSGRLDFSIEPLITAGILLFSLAVLFQLVTLPVEFNASSRALKLLGSTGILGEQEVGGARKVLSAAAMTYVAALAASILQLLRLIILSGGRRDRD